MLLRIAASLVFSPAERDGDADRFYLDSRGVRCNLCRRRAEHAISDGDVFYRIVENGLHQFHSPWINTNVSLAVCSSLLREWLRAAPVVRPVHQAPLPLPARPAHLALSRQNSYTPSSPDQAGAFFPDQKLLHGWPEPLEHNDWAGRFIRLLRRWLTSMASANMHMTLPMP